MFALTVGTYELQWHDWAWLGVVSVFGLAGLVRLLFGLGGGKKG